MDTITNLLLIFITLCSLLVATAAAMDLSSTIADLIAERRTAQAEQTKADA